MWETLDLRTGIAIGVVTLYVGWTMRKWYQAAKYRRKAEAAQKEADRLRELADIRMDERDNARADHGTVLSKLQVAEKTLGLARADLNDLREKLGKCKEELASSRTAQGWLEKRCEELTGEVSQLQDEVGWKRSADAQQARANDAQEQLRELLGRRSRLWR